MATLEEIAQQFEDALTESTGTTVKPGTITPKGVVSPISGKKKLSWPEVVEKINEGMSVRQNELLPEVPEGISAQKFYRTAAQSGLLPSGVSTFTSAPYCSFQSRIGVTQGTKPDTSTPESAEEPVATPKSVIQKQGEVLYEGGLSFDDERSNYASPIANPDVSLATIPAMLAAPMATMIKLSQSPNVYTSLQGYTEGQIQDMLSRGWLSTEQVEAHKSGITHMNNLGQPVNPDTGKRVTRSEYINIMAEKENKNLLSTLWDKIRGPSEPEKETKEEEDIDIDVLPPLEEPRAAHPDLDVYPILGPSFDPAQNPLDRRGRQTYAELRSPMDQQEEESESPERGKGGTDVDDSGGDYDATSDDWSGYNWGDAMFQDGGAVKMQDGGMAPQGAEADMSNLGMINEQAAQPQQGGAVSVKDDIPREADEGDYILPYETVLLVGLKDLNRYAREAIDLAMKNGVNLKGTDLDPTDDVPIKVSNYEYHIPKILVPFFGGGKKYLDKIRQEGLDLRKRLEEEKQPSLQEQQPMAEAQPASAQPAPAQAATAPQAPMMQQGGFVDDPKKKQMQTSAAVLEADASQQSPSAYNQMQALERTRRKAQQPPMVDPMGRVVEQGFVAPQGYAEGDEVKQETMPAWASRALDPKTPVLKDEATGDIKTVRTMSINYKGKEILFPTIRMKGKELVQLSEDEALAEALKKNDYISFDTPAQATEWSKNFSKTVGDLRGVQQGFANGTESGGVSIEEEKQTPMTEQRASSEPRDKIGLDTIENNLEPSFFSGSDPFMQKRTEPMKEIEVDESGFTEDSDIALGDILGQSEQPMPTEEMARAKQAMQTLKNLPDLALMAIVAIGEARNQDREGMQAVMHVMKNRLKYPKRFGKNINEIITKKHQFSALLPDLDDPETYKGPRFENFKTMMKINYKDKIFQDAVRDADKIMKGELPDVTKGSTHYYNFETIEPPSWAKDMVENIRIKSHIFLGINPKAGLKNGGFVERVFEEAA